MLIQLIYRSVPVIQPAIATAEFVPVALKTNEVLDITGMILADKNGYIQVLEGEKDHVDELYKSILADPRHTDVRMIRYMPIPEREFSTWSMRHVRVKSLSELSDEDAIKLLYKSADNELSKTVVRTIVMGALTSIIIFTSIVVGGPALESRYSPVLENVETAWVKSDKAHAEVIVTGKQVKACDFDGIYMTTSEGVKAYAKLMDMSPKENDRFFIRLSVIPTSDEYRVEIRHQCIPLWSQSQKAVIEKPSS